MGFQHPAIDVLHDFLPALSDLKNVAALPLPPFVKLPVHSRYQDGDDPLGHEIIAVLEVQQTCCFRALPPSKIAVRGRYYSIWWILFEFFRFFDYII